MGFDDQLCVCLCLPFWNLKEEEDEPVAAVLGLIGSRREGERFKCCC